ncbi:MAG TPA: hypothetical protein VJH67_03680 [Candidatus Paceibacterota bacterium]
MLLTHAHIAALPLLKDKAVTKIAIVQFRWAIREHRDKKGKERCWSNDPPLYRTILGIEPEKVPPTRAASLIERYMRERSALSNPKSPQVMPHDPDRDLEGLGYLDLCEKFWDILVAVVKHYDKGDWGRTAETDRQLYKVLPEGIEA